MARERRSPESTIEPPSCEKEKRGERAEFDFGGNDVSADKDNQQKGVNALSMSAIKGSLSRYCVE